MAIKAYKYRLYPSPAEQETLNRIIGSTRYIYNALLALTQAQYQAHLANPTTTPKPNLSAYGLSNLLPALKQDPTRPWLLDTSAVAYQQKAHDLANAYRAFFTKTGKARKAGYPRFKKKSHGGSFRLMPNAFSIQDGKLHIAKCPTGIKVKWSRELPSQPSQVTITKTPSGQYYASLLCEYTPTPTTGEGIIGIDLGITDLATISTGEVIPNPRHYLACQARLARLQRALSRKQKGSHNRHKARIRVARLHQRICNQRQDHLHQLTTRLVRDNQAIAIEDLSVGNMARNRHLSKAIMTAGWSIFRQLLTYKAIASQHCRLIIADRYYPSTQLCSACGQKPTVKLPLATRQWTCEHCHTTHARDPNASHNLHGLAQETLAWAQAIAITEPIILARPYEA